MKAEGMEGYATMMDLRTNALADSIKIQEATGLFLSKNDWQQKLRRVLFLVPIHVTVFLNAINLGFCDGNLWCIIENLSTNVQLLVASHISNCVWIFNKDYQDAYHALNQLNFRYFSEEKVQKLESSLNKKFYFFITFLIGSATGWSLFTFIHKYKCDELKTAANGTRPFPTPCGMPLPTWYPSFIDIETSPGYQIAFLYEAFIFIDAGSVLAISVSLPFGLCLYILEHLKQLKQKLNQVCMVKRRNRLAKLRKCIEYHIKILECGVKLGRAYNMYFATQIFFLSLIFGTSGFQIFMATQNSDYLVMFQFGWTSVAWFSETFLSCFLGELLINESESIGDCVYNLPWYEESKEFGSLILMIILRAQKPIAFSSASLSVLRITSITAVMSHTYSAFNLAVHALFD